MDKKLKIYIGLLVFILVGIVYIESIKPKEINWFPSYDAKHKIPYGTYILHKEMPTLFANKKVQTIYESPYLFLKDTINTGTYFFVDAKLNFGEEEFHELLEFVARGNNVFMATNSISIDTLNVETKHITTSAFEEKAYHKIINKKLDTKEYHFDREFPKTCFSSVDTLKTTVLGELVIRNEKDTIVAHQPNFIKTKFGKGFFYLHTFPQAFTNYNMLLNNNHNYVASVLSYLNTNTPNKQVLTADSSTILWDAYYKTGKSQISSPMHYILSSKHLKWAYYTVLIGVLFLVIFKGKREQRIIPIVNPLKNQTLAFTRTIANMYYEKSDHKNIAVHKINYFLEYIRTHHRLSTLKIDDVFYENLASRSGNSVESVEKLFKKITIIQSKEKITEEELVALNIGIEEFKKES